MKVVHLSTYSTGGAALAASRLHVLLCESGIDSSLICLYKNASAVKKTVDFRDSLSFFQKLKKKIQNKQLSVSNQNKIEAYGKAPELFSFPETVWNIAEHPEIKNADVIHLHWVAGFADYSFFNDPVLKSKNIIWTLHDINPFSGGFHYEGWFDPAPWKALSETNLKIKQQLLNNADIKIIAPSQWMMNLSQTSGVFKAKKHFHIPNPSSKVFSYRGRDLARKELGLNSSELICFIPADDPEYLRKGIKELEHRLQKNKLNITFLSTGKRQLNIADNKQVHFSEISSELKMALCYNAADLVAFPSLEENLSNTLVEAILCGCPVLCFDTGGNKEIVKDGAYGRTITKGNWDYFIRDLNTLSFNEKQRHELAKLAAKELDSATLLQKFVEVYEAD